MRKTAPSSTLIYQLAFGLAFLFVCYGAVRAMMFGSTGNARQIAFFSLAFGVIMSLDTKYWLLLPLCMSLGLSIPGVPFNSVELGCIVFSGMHLIRTTMHRDALVPANKGVLTVFPLFFWICFIWIINPPGLNILHSESMGMRFYLKILFGFFAFCSLSKIKLEESDCKLLFRVLLVGATLSVVLTFLHPSLYDTNDEFQPATDARYYLLTLAGLYSLVWARYSMLEIIKSPSLLIIIGGSALGLVVSGKRSATASVVLLPVYRSLLTRKQLGATLSVLVLAFGVLVVAVSLDGYGIRIPNSAKRSLAIVFPKYRTHGREGITDSFRENIHSGARELIRQHPWMGRKGYRMDRDTSIWLFGLGFQDRFSGHMFSGNWHGSVWAYSADFGLPGLVFYLFFVWNCLRMAFRAGKRFPLRSYRNACILYYSFGLVHRAVFMFSSGHSSITTVDDMLALGMLMAIMNGSRNIEGNPDLDTVDQYSIVKS